jgi:capsular polysaccharide biosynthesis protein
MSFKIFTEKVNVNLVKDTEIIKIQVMDTDPKLAAEIANETAEVFMDSVKTIMKVENVQVIDKAQPPENPVKPRPKLNMAIAGVLGIMAGVFLAFLLEYMDNTLKTPEDIEKHLGLPVLGAIPMVKDE